MRLRIVFAIMGFVLLFANKISAQSYPEEALLFSRIRSGGTARVQAMGGVQTAIGADISSGYYNPAGLGMYNRSDFSITPGYSMSNSDASYLGNTLSQNKNTMIIPNLGVAFHTNKNGDKGLWGGTFSISFNRINDFNNTFSYSGTNTHNSIIDYFIANANGSTEAQFGQGGFNSNTPTSLAYDNYLIGPLTVIDPTYANDQYFTDVYPYYPTQTEVVKTTGSQNQWNFSYGVNFNDKIFLGGGIGFSSFSYKAVKSYTETFYDPYTFPNGSTGVSPMSKMVMNETLSLNGSGINATIGAIIRPVDAFQFGLTIATPTSYQVTDNYNADMNTKWNNFQYDPSTVLNNESSYTDLVTSSYNLVTPWRISGGGTYFFEKKGFISAEVEWLNYSASHYSSSYGDDWSADNKTISGLYKSTFNIRAGGEYRLNNYRIRAGYNLMPDPFQTPQNGTDRSIASYSTGVGYRTSSFYIDLAAILTQGNNSYRPYSVSSQYSPLVNLKNQTTTIMITVGFPF